jgi:small neutral amino acid transporter SnatA (MarC family)
MNLRKLFGWIGISAVSLITALLLVLLGLEFLVSDNLWQIWLQKSQATGLMPS